MRRSHTELYVHLVWSTWDRLPLIRPDHEDRLLAAIEAKCRQLGAEPLAIGGTGDHIHLLVELPSDLAVATLVREAKGSSSHLMTHEVWPAGAFKWQGAYAAFSIGKERVAEVTTYIHHQREHHALGSADRYEEIDQIE